MGLAGREAPRVPRDRDPDRARADRRDRRLRPLLPSTRARLLAGDHPQRVLLRRVSSTAGTSPSAGNHHARRLLIEAAWHYRHAPRRPSSGPQPSDRAWQAQVRLLSPPPPPHRARQTLDRRDRRCRPRARRLPLGRAHRPATTRGAARRLTRAPTPTTRTGQHQRPNTSWGPATGVTRRRDPRCVYAIPTRDFSSRQLNDRTLSCGPDPRISE